MSVIEMHSTWLAINSIIGCSNGCRYCLLQGNNDNNKTRPKEIVSPSMAVKELINSKYYDSSIPVCLLPNTDPFLNKKNIKYLKDLIIELDKNSIYNVLTIITKCKITNDVIDLVKLMELKGHKIIFYISYSGLNNIMEPNINANDIKYNFKLLKENNIPIVHYFRPLLPQNSSKKIIDDVLNYVKKYTNISVISGLNLIPTFIDKIDFWDEIKELTKEIKNELFKRNSKLSISKNEFNKKIKEMNDYLVGISKRNGINLKNIDLSYTKNKEKYLENYILNSIINHANYHYRKENNKLIYPTDIIQSIILNIYKRHKNITKKRIVINSFNNNYELTNEFRKAIHHINQEMEEAAQEFYIMSSLEM